MKIEELRSEILRVSTEDGHPASVFDALVCDCGSETFTLFSDEKVGGALAVCSECEANHSIYDTADFLEDIGQNICACEHDVLRLMVGFTLDGEGENADWVYVGAECTHCGLVGVFVDWEEV